MREAFLESLSRVLGAVTARLPALLAALLILFFAALAAGVVRGIVRYLCGRIALDRSAHEWGFVASPTAEGGVCLSLLVSRLAGWTVLAFGFVAALSTFEGASTSALAMRLGDYLPHAFVAIMFLALGAAGSRGLERRVITGSVNIGLPSARLIGLGARWLVLLLSVAIALEHLGVGREVVPLAFEILLAGITLAITLAVGLGARDVVASSFSRRFPTAGTSGVSPEREEEIHHL
jgi:hypothetical protein